jgi:hypothetical protein
LASDGPLKWKKMLNIMIVTSQPDPSHPLDRNKT